MIADSFQRLGEGRKASRVRSCGSQLTFAVEVNPVTGELTGEKKLHDANFCRERLCPMCAWRRSLKIFHQVGAVMDKVQEMESALVPIFLTLTLRNCAPTELAGTLDAVFSGWYQLTKHRKVQRVIQGWFRALEVTYNKQDDTFHPHIHAILLVGKSYFRKENTDYLPTTEWVRLWRQALKLDYDPVCDVRKVRGRKRKAVAEVAKYTVKDTDYIYRDNPDLTDKLVKTLGGALKNRRLYAFGGVMKEAARLLKADNVGEGDLIHVDEENTLRGDLSYVLVTYRWNMGLTNYIAESVSPLPTDAR